MNQQKFQQAVQLVSSHRGTHTKCNLSARDLKNMVEHAELGNEMAFIYLVEWYFSFKQSASISTAYESRLFESLTPYFKN